MIIPDTTENFPVCPTYGFVARPKYRVVTTVRDGGYELVDQRWRQPLLRFEGVPMGDQPEADLQEALYFWHAHAGETELFRFKDWTDYLNCKTNEVPELANAQPFVETDDGLQLVKQYVLGAKTRVRNITRPVGATIEIYDNVGDVIDGANWTLDEATGVLTIDSGLNPNGWTGAFDVPCRFEGDFPLEVSSHKVQSLTLTIKEIRE